MKCLKYFLCFAFLASMLLAVPSGCGSSEATKIDASKYPAQDNADEEEVVSPEPGGG